MTDKWLVGAIDHGTTSTRMLIFDRTGTIVCSAQREVKLQRPREGWAEHDPTEALTALDECMRECGSFLEDRGWMASVKTIGVAVHRESVVAIDAATGKPESSLVLWMDTRTRELVQDQLTNAKIISSKTGLRPSTYFSAFKMQWLKSQIGKRVKFATVDALLVNHLTGQFKTDVTNASRTMLLNLDTKQFDPELLGIFGIDNAQLPQVVPSKSDFGVVSSGAFKGIPVTAVLGDQQASLHGHNCVHEGQAKCTLGTGAFILINSGRNKRMFDEFVTTIIADGKYAVEAPIAMGASGTKWFKDNFGEFSIDAPSSGVLFVPALTGLLSPFWRPDLAGSFHNVSLATSRDNMGAAVLEAIAFSVAYCLEILTGTYNVPIESIKVDGGLSNHGRLVQMISDCSNIKVLLATMKECTALGAAIGAAEHIGLKFEDSINTYSHVSPKHDRKDTLDNYSRWKMLMAKLTEYSPSGQGASTKIADECLL